MKTSTTLMLVAGMCLLASLYVAFVAVITTLSLTGYWQ